MAAKKYYAYRIPRTGQSGVTDDWKKCEALVKGETGARFKAFGSKEEAEEWLRRGAAYGTKIVKPGLTAGVYFDAGTGRGAGVEISVTDEKGNDLLSDILSGNHINRFGKHLIKNATNNYGELLACKYALLLAKKRGAKKVFGDSALVIEYWSRGIIKKTPTIPLPAIPVTKKAVSEETIRLAAEVTKLRKEFEGAGGEVKHISGADNPADLGFHRN